jgi:hypothetical protein
VSGPGCWDGSAPATVPEAFALPCLEIARYSVTHCPSAGIGGAVDCAADLVRPLPLQAYTNFVQASSAAPPLAPPKAGLLDRHWCRGPYSLRLTLLHRLTM